MTLSPSLRGGSSYTGAILPRRPPRLGAAGFTDPVGSFIKRAIRIGPSPGRRLESRSSPAELTLFCAVPTAPGPFPSPSSFPAPRRPCRGLQPGSEAPAPSHTPQLQWGALVWPECGVKRLRQRPRKAPPSLTPGSGLMENSGSVAE